MKIKTKYLKNKLGFTLIELLIAIAILGILTASLLASYTITQKRAKDAERKHDLKQIQEALELFFHDNEAYPTPDSDQGLGFGGTFTSTEGVIYMQKIPSDSKGDRDYYYTQSTHQDYKLYACLENINDSAKTDYTGTENRCGSGCGVCTYGVSSPNTTP